MATDLNGMIGLGALGALVGAYFIFVIILYVYFAFALMTIAKKTNTPNAWLAWIPIANHYLMTQIAGLSGWHTVFFLLMFIPVIGAIAFLGITIWWFWRICEVRNRPGWWALLLLVPVVNLVIPGILAWKDN